MNKKPNAADTLRRALARHGDVKTDADSVRAAIDPREPDQPMQWYDKVIAIGEAQTILKRNGPSGKPRRRRRRRPRSRRLRGFSLPPSPKPPRVRTPRSCR